LALKLSRRCTGSSDQIAVVTAAQPGLCIITGTARSRAASNHSKVWLL